jgi:hypothetical protein
MFILLTLLARHVAISATPSSDTIPTATASTPTTSQPPTTTGGGVPPPTQTQDGANPSCQKWYVVVKGDGCWAIANTAGIGRTDVEVTCITRVPCFPSAVHGKISGNGQS